MIRDIEAKIVYNEPIKGDYWQIGLKTGWMDYVPGQFVMLDVAGEETFLRRPFSIARLEKGVIEICYKVVGKGTKKMTTFSAGSSLFVLGPLGNGFDVGVSRGTCRVSLLVAGGYGVAPLLGLAGKLVKSQDGAVSLFYGAKTADDLILLGEFEKLGVELHIATEDGSMGTMGMITGILERFLTDSRIYACGPDGMLDAVKLLAHKKKIACQLSLESYMACGSGVCLGCVIKDRHGKFVRVCREGPVFDYKNVTRDT